MNPKFNEDCADRAVIEQWLSSIEAREKKATLGPWHSKDNRREQGINHFAILTEDEKVMPCSITPMSHKRTEDVYNADFIACSRTDIPALLLLARKYREALEVACVASCSCMTKSGDYELHAETCRYKQLRTALAYDPARGREMTGPVLEERTNREGSG